jgi:hypothetical protein
MKDSLKRCKQGNNPNELPLSGGTIQLINKSLEELIDEVGKSDLKTNIGWTPDTGMIAQATRQQVQIEMTRRLIVELRNFNKSTTSLNYILITLTIVLVFLTVVQILLIFKHH